jgi:hemerythrin-like domain-containing protein
VASPQVAMEIGTEDGNVKPLATRAVVLGGPERDRLYQRQSAINPAFREYQEKTTRTIGVVALYPLDLSENPDRRRMLGEQLMAHHQTLRAGLDRIRTEIQGVISGNSAISGKPPPEDAHRAVADLADQLRQHCLSYCYGLQMHHIREDGSFSAVEQQFPHLTPPINRLRSEHRLVAQALAGFEALVSRGAASDVSDLEDLRIEFDHVVSGLEEHFAYEEHHLLAALNEAHPAR